MHDYLQKTGALDELCHMIVLEAHGFASLKSIKIVNPHLLDDIRQLYHSLLEFILCLMCMKLRDNCSVNLQEQSG